MMPHAHVCVGGGSCGAVEMLDVCCGLRGAEEMRLSDIRLQPRCLWLFDNDSNLQENRKNILRPLSCIRKAGTLILNLIRKCVVRQMYHFSV